MTTVRSNPNVLQQTSIDTSFVVRWTAALNRFSQPDWIDQSETMAGQQRGELFVAVHVVGERASFESWMVYAGANRHSVQPKRLAPCTVCIDNEYIHIDVFEGDQAILKMTIDDHGALVFLRSALPGHEAMPAGLLDPPSLVDMQHHRA